MAFSADLHDASVSVPQRECEGVSWREREGVLCERPAIFYKILFLKLKELELKKIFRWGGEVF